MSFLNEVKSFIALAKESNFDLVQIHSQNPNGVYISIAILLLLLLIIVFFIRRSMKISSAVKLVSKIQGAKDFNEYNSNLTKLVTELPKRGIKVANSINMQKKDILEQELNLMKDLDIKDKIAKYQQISSQYSMMAKNSQKYNIEELTSFYSEKSQTLLSEDLANDIKEYCDNTEFNEESLDNINAIVKYANSREDKENIIKPLIEQIDRNSYGYNLDFYKFIKSLSKEDSLDLYEHCNRKLDEILDDEEGKVSEQVLFDMLDNEDSPKVYNYISNLKDEIHLKNLYSNMFGKSDDIKLDLAFVANDMKLDLDYKSHIDNKLTENWKDLAYIKDMIEAPGIINAIGHIDYRNVLERVEKLQTQDENNKAIAQALEMSRDALSIANEAKAIARSK